MSILSDQSKIFRYRSSAFAFFISIIVWGVGSGCYAAVLNNFLVDIYHLTPFERGWLEFFRESPGLMLVFVLALLHKTSDWKILRISSFISMLGAIALLIPADKIFITFLIMIWSLGEHLVMPVRTSIAMQLAHEGKQGRSLGLVTSAQNAGTVAGSIIVALVFYFGTKKLQITNSVVLYNTVWIIIFLLITAAFLLTFTQNITNKPSKRPRLYFHRKFNIFYVLELFYGARKQIFMTFAPFVLISVYKLNTSQMALLFGTCAAVNIFGSPIIGRITDRLGYKNVMIWDTVILFFVCILYGYAGKWFSAKVAVWVVCINFVLDAILSTTSLATNIYVRDIASGDDEVTSSISTGISINHLISIISAPIGGWVWQRYGVQVLFNFAAGMAVANTVCACMIRKVRD